MHFHMHVIPRYEGGPANIANWVPGTASAEELTESSREDQRLSVVTYDQTYG